MDATHDEMLADYYAHQYFDDPKLAEVDEDDDFDPDEVERLISKSNPDEWENVGEL